MTVLLFGKHCCISSPFVCLPYQKHVRHSPDTTGRAMQLLQMRQDARARCKQALAGAMPSFSPATSASSMASTGFVGSISSHARPVPHQLGSAHSTWTQLGGMPGMPASRTMSGVGQFLQAGSVYNNYSIPVNPGDASFDLSHSALSVIPPPGHPPSSSAGPPNSAPSFRGSDDIDESYYLQSRLSARVEAVLPPGKPGSQRQSQAPAVALDAAQTLLGIRTNSYNTDPDSRNPPYNVANGTASQHAPRQRRAGGQKRPRSYSAIPAAAYGTSMPHQSRGPPRAAGTSPFTAKRDRSWPAHAASRTGAAPL